MRIIILIALSLLGPIALHANTQAVAAEKQITFETFDGTGSVPALEGKLTVPENRANPESRDLTLSYVRFPATGEQKGPPIIYLAGGPGGSGINTAKARRFPLFMAMREFGDVIALDQRGTGKSNDTPPCTSSIVIGLTENPSDTEVAERYRAAANECATFWQAQGFDIHGYTTRESVADLDDLRQHLGADKVVLWGTSYGSHLSLAAMKYIGEHIDRVVISSAEGLDQTVKLPARTDAYFGRLQEAIDAQPAARAIYPDVAGLIRRVHDRLDQEPVLLRLPMDDGTGTDLLLTRRFMQQAASGLIADPENIPRLLGFYLAVDQEHYDPLIPVLKGCCASAEPISFRLMPLMMDLASGITADRLALVEAQAETSLLATYLNMPMPQVLGSVEGLDLGDEFRSGPTSNIPTLLLTGTLDGRTYVDGQAEAVAGLANVTQVIVHNAGHNLFMASPQVTEAIQAFMRGTAQPRGEIIIPLPEFAAVPQQ